MEHLFLQCHAFSWQLCEFNEVQRQVYARCASHETLTVHGDVLNSHRYSAEVDFLKFLAGLLVKLDHIFQRICDYFTI